MTRRRFATVLAGVAVLSLFFVPDTPWPWLLLPAGVALVAIAVYVSGDLTVGTSRAMVDAEVVQLRGERDDARREVAELDNALDDLVVEVYGIAEAIEPATPGLAAELRAACKRAMGNEAEPAAPAPPGECPACPHQRVEHSGYGCDRCTCRVNIIDLTPLPVWEVPFR